jgi:uncharacterized lipoprotein YddW (UPF0748 family)
MRLTWLLMASLLMGSIAVGHAQVVVARGALLAKASPNVAGDVNTYAARVTGLLNEVGVSHKRIDDSDLAQGALNGASVAILPYNHLDAAATQALSQFVGRGGKIIAFYTTAPPEFYRLMGVEIVGAKTAEFEEQFAYISFTPEAGSVLPALPAKVRQDSWIAMNVMPLSGTEVIGHWITGNGRRAVPAVTRSSAGVFVGHVLTGADTEAKSFWLLSLVAALDERRTDGAPTVWLDALNRNLRKARQLASQLNGKLERGRKSQPSNAARLKDITKQCADLTRQLKSVENSCGAARSAVECAQAVQQIYNLQKKFVHLGFAMVPPREGEIRGVWFFASAKQDWDAVMKRLKDNGFNCIFVRVARGANAIYPSAFLPREKWAEDLGGDELKRAIAAARRYGIAFHAWKVCHHMGKPSDGFFDGNAQAREQYYRAVGPARQAFWEKMLREDRLVRDSKGRQSFWLTPADPRNRELEYQVMMELVKNYDVDGVHFDYIRYPDDSPYDDPYDYDYGATSRREFEKFIGRPVNSWPDDVRRGALKIKFEDWERENVNTIVRRVSKDTKQAKPWVKISAAVWRNHRRYRAVIKQDWLRWAEQGWVDFLVPMDYTPLHNLFADTVKAQVSAVRGKVPLAAGIGGYLLKTPDDMVKQVEISRRSGADGFVWFSWNDEDLNRKMSALAAGATSKPTYPAYNVPHLDFAITDTVPQKDAPLAVTAQTPSKFWVRVRQGSSPRSPQRVTGQLVLEDLEGQSIDTLATINAPRAKEYTAFAPIPQGIYRPVARGTLFFRDGKTKPFAVRGPLVEGMTAEAIAALKARELPAQVADGGRRVGIFAGGLGADGLMTWLKEKPQVVAFFLHGLRPDHLRVADVVILPQLADVADLTEETVQALREWVQAGGTLILTHDAVGFRWHVALFPEVGYGTELSQRRGLVTVSDLPDVAPALTFAHSYLDHVRLAPANGATVLVREDGADGAAVVVARPLGRGRIVLNGMIPGYGEDWLTSEAERRVLWSLMQWRGEP